MGAVWIWIAAAASYGVFTLWYRNFRGPLSLGEIDAYMAKLRASAGGVDPARQPQIFDLKVGLDRIAFDHILYCLIPIAAVGRPESSSRPESRFAGRSPQSEIRHARQPLQPGLRQHLETLHHGVEQHA